MKTNSLAARLAAKTTLYFSARSENLAVKEDALTWTAGGVAKAHPLADIRRIVLLGRAPVEHVLYDLLRQNIPIDWLNQEGAPLGQIYAHACDAPSSLIQAQAGFAGGMDLAKNLLLAKFDNCREVLRRKIQISPLWLERRLALLAADSFENLRGAEGQCAKIYFSHWAELLPETGWTGRHSRPPADVPNLLLSLGYTLLYNRLASALRHAGLNPRTGFYHLGRGAHCALASDLMEPLRPLVDSWALNLLRHHEVRPEQFAIKSGRCVCAQAGVFPLLMGSFEKMFNHVHIFYSNGEKRARSLNDCLDDLALSFRHVVLESGPIFLPGLSKCPASSSAMT